MRLPSLLRALPPAVAGVAALSGGLYFGLLPCGGHPWHRQVFWAALGATIALACLAPPRALAPAPRRLGFVALTVAAFLLARAASSPFHPAPPGSASEYLRRAFSGLVAGTC
jgi:hypothetical protein